jgi:hypothetical protein
MTTKKHDDEHDEPVGHDEDGNKVKAEREAKAKAEAKAAPARSEEEMERMRREDPAFLDKTRPEDPSGRPGQLTRDNVNPHIPSGKRGDPPGPIVDPNSLGMEQGGVAPANPMKPETPDPARAPKPAPQLDRKRGKDD